MRRILIDNARRKNRLKRSGKLQKVDLQKADKVMNGPSTDLLALDEALSKLDKTEHKVADLVKMHFYAGLSLDQAATALGISRRTADRYWAYARAWLYQEIACEGRTFLQ